MNTLVRVLRRCERGSLFVTSNKSFLDWGEILNGDVLAAAILAPLLHYATTLNIKGESYRLKDGCKAGLLGQPKPVEAEAEQEVIMQVRSSTDMVTDDQGTYCSGDLWTFRPGLDIIRQGGMTHVRTTRFYPQSNGKIERWRQSLMGE